MGWLKFGERLKRIRVLPRYYFVVSGAALSPVSPLNAFDGALKMAGVHNTNLVEVSSILPKGVRHLDLTREEVEALFEPGEIIYTVRACEMGRDGEWVSAGLIWGEGLDANGLVAEHSQVISSKGDLKREELREGMKELMRAEFQEGVHIRGLTTREPRLETAEIFVPEGMYGCAIALLVLC